MADRHDLGLRCRAVETGAVTANVVAWKLHDILADEDGRFAIRAYDVEDKQARVVAALLPSAGVLHECALHEGKEPCLVRRDRHPLQPLIVPSSIRRSGDRIEIRNRNRLVRLRGGRELGDVRDLLRAVEAAEIGAVFVRDESRTVGKHMDRLGIETEEIRHRTAGAVGRRHGAHRSTQHGVRSGRIQTRGELHRAAIVIGELGRSRVARNDLALRHRTRAVVGREGEGQLMDSSRVVREIGCSAHVGIETAVRQHIERAAELAGIVSPIGDEQTGGSAHRLAKGVQCRARHTTNPHQTVIGDRQTVQRTTIHARREGSQVGERTFRCGSRIAEDAVADHGFPTVHGFGDDLVVDAWNSIHPGDEIRRAPQITGIHAAVVVAEAELEIRTVDHDLREVLAITTAVGVGVEEVFERVWHAVIVRVTASGAAEAIVSQPGGKGGRSIEHGVGADGGALDTGIERGGGFGEVVSTRRGGIAGLEMAG